MARPNITSVSPSAGHVGGRFLVEILGSNFQLSPSPPATGIAPVPNPSVEVLFGDSLGTNVGVVSEGRLFVVCPMSPRDPADSAGAVDVTVRNIDQNGDVIPGESVTAAGAFTYARSNLSEDADMTRLCRQLIRELKRQLLANTTWSVDTDYRDEQSNLNLEHISSPPAIVLFGPQTPENRFYSTNEPRELAQGSDEYFVLRPPYTVDLVFSVLGVAEKDAPMLNLMKETISFFQRNKTISMLCDPDDASQGSVTYEMEIDSDGDLRRVGGSNRSNIRAFSGTFRIRAFDIDDPSVGVVPTKELTEGALIGQSETLGDAGDSDTVGSETSGVVQFYPDS